VRILIVEDHAATLAMLGRALREAGHTTEGARDLAGARKMLAGGGYGAIILDWMLPDGSGPDLCREMRRDRDATPVLLLTAKGEVGDRVTGLDSGADDYLRKPFAVAELRARVRALLRRGPRFESSTVRLHGIQVRLDERRVFVEGRETHLTSREFAILEILLRHHGRAVSRNTLIQTVWGSDTDGADASLEVLISRMRRKLSTGGDDLIQTHRGFGYSLRFEA
jgi:DNA-binding response OmpR family regulator